MLSVLNRIVASSVLIFTSSAAFASGAGPRILREPVFGLHYEMARVKFDPLPAQALANCETLADSENLKSVWFVYGQVRDTSGRTFYVAGSYDIWQDGRPAYQKFEVEDLGVVFYTDRGACEPLDPARDVFDQRNFDNVLTQPILKQLAVDVVQRLERAFGGPERLRLELRNQRINLDTLPPELRDAMKAYLSK